MLERTEEWLREVLKKRHQDRLMQYCGGIQWCPWCRQVIQDYDESTIVEYEPDRTLDLFTCGNCYGESIWLWGMGFHLMKLGAPPPGRRKGWLYDKEHPPGQG